MPLKIPGYRTNNTSCSSCGKTVTAYNDCNFPFGTIADYKECLHIPSPRGKYEWLCLECGKKREKECKKDIQTINTAFKIYRELYIDCIELKNNIDESLRDLVLQFSNKYTIPENILTDLSNVIDNNVICDKSTSKSICRKIRKAVYCDFFNKINDYSKQFFPFEKFEKLFNGIYNKYIDKVTAYIKPDCTYQSVELQEIAGCFGPIPTETYICTKYTAEDLICSGPACDGKKQIEMCFLEILPIHCKSCTDEIVAKLITKV